ncbi:hypothetical protein HNP46_004647 [Pseudomonas nitritireducens]|uniref:Uncharacterized protein n=1 Tax=Pseudomonas nitroreducens TaxID=46680 RepID=A0A7W7P2M4_PSENT|nr:hypothetical protein [Pseudomonas nitritireducens]MBB4865746.1 hypothetical protein [Pseudomonas nitritireducens]
MNRLLKISLLGLMAWGSQALAEEPKLTDLLGRGYEIKSAYWAPGRVVQIHFLILQKGSSAYQCTTYEGGSFSQQYYDYSNTYSCSAIGDLVPKAGGVPGQ